MLKFSSFYEEQAKELDAAEGDEATSGNTSSPLPQTPTSPLAASPLGPDEPTAKGMSTREPVGMTASLGSIESSQPAPFRIGHRRTTKPAPSRATSANMPRAKDGSGGLMWQCSVDFGKRKKAPLSAKDGDRGSKITGFRTTRSQASVVGGGGGAGGMPVGQPPREVHGRAGRTRLGKGGLGSRAEMGKTEMIASSSSDQNLSLHEQVVARGKRRMDVGKVTQKARYGLPILLLHSNKMHDTICFFLLSDTH